MNRIRLVVLAVVALALPAASAETSKFDRSYPFVGDKDVKVGIKVGDVTIESFRIRHWPDSDDFEKARKDLNDTHTMVVEFTVLEPGPRQGLQMQVRGHDSGRQGRQAVRRERPDGHARQRQDRRPNSMFLKMHTNDYKVAKTVKISFEIWRK